MMTKEELLKKSDAELLEMISKSANHTGRDFQTHMQCEFSYTYLTNALRKRGYDYGWYKVDKSPTIARESEVEVIPMKKSHSDTIRQSFVIDAETAALWKDFNKNVPFKSVTLGSALRRFMADVNAGRIIFKLEI